MPQVDLEILVPVCGGGDIDGKIACETLTDETTEHTEHPADVPPDFPPESYCLSKDAELDWFDRNAFYERKESTKGNSNNSTNLNSNASPSSNSNSQGFPLNLKSKASFLALPKTPKATYVDAKRRTSKQANIRLFPKQSESIGKSAVSVTEPSSPKVSCMGRVRSKRGLRRSSESTKKDEEPAEQSTIGNDRRKTGFCSRLIAIFRPKRRRETAIQPGFETKEQTVESPSRRSVTVKASIEPVAEPPGLGGMARFSSGRRSESWNRGH
ncbi:unnamed protein product [Ilex paraguariensis]|uniref:Uncharacterized protein n=1 Tax=Ilex paraguariensis TaxID=185542 RepID=A0ABC8UDG4_9AQUA